MICPRCSNEISEQETRCPYCHEKIVHDKEYNDYKLDGFVRLQNKITAESESKKQKSKKNQSGDEHTYFNFSEMNVFVFSIIFLLIIAVVTVFGFKALQHWTKDTEADRVVPVYVPTYETTAPVKPTKNTVKEVSIENIYGSWRNIDTVEQSNYAIPYYSFADDGAAQYDFGSFTVQGHFEDYSTDKKKIVYIEIENQLTGVFTYNVKGNKTDGYKLTLKGVHSNAQYTFVTAKAKTYKLTPIEDFKTDKAIIGEWENKDGNRTYTFTKDGRFSRSMEDQTMKGVWTKYDDEHLSLKYMETYVTTINVQYATFEDTLVINNVIYHRKK